jgi:sialic acid synthase SpsE
MRIDIIAELAQGFEGRPEQARLLMKAAASAGADAAKYQLVYADELATPDYKYYDLFRSLEMADEVWMELSTYAKELGITLQVDIFGSRSLELAETIGASGVKLHGTDIANLGLLAEVARSSVPKVLLGAGGAWYGEIEHAVSALKNKEVVVLLGFQGYPTPTETNQIARVRMLVARLVKNHPHVSIGFADHASPDSPLRYALAAVAVGAGASVIEKHLTFGQVMKLEDHESALNPDQFLEFTETLRACAEAMGTAHEATDFGMSESEQGYRKMIRRHVVAGADLRAGQVISPADLVLKRTSSEQIMTDLAPVYGMTLKRNLLKNAPLAAADIK